MSLEALRKEFQMARVSFEIADNDENLGLSEWLLIIQQYNAIAEEYIAALEEALDRL